MLSKVSKIDRFFLISISALTLVGFVIFLSASLGLLTQDGVNFGTVATKQIISLVIGIIAFIVFSRIKYTYLRKSALFILIGAIVINLLLFIPSLTLFHGGAARWINIGPLSFQPSEFLKIAFIIYLAAWIQFAKDKISTLKFGLAPYLVITAILGALLLAQSDTDTFLIIAFTGVVMLLVAGMPLKHMAMAGGALFLVVIAVVLLRPYAYQRVQTFFSGGSDTRGAGYQINQSLIAIGSGEVTGRGFGQSIQKFGYLPQPTDDSIFAVASEEFGFIGSSLLVILYLLVAASIFRIAGKSPDLFGSAIAVGIAMLIITESFLNMSAMLGIVPLSGVPLLFVSHGGTALIIILAAAGIVANVSRYTKS
ncbi:MAG TPA: putative peptidoglycan glycosyltransferase FtsW [Candidatus Paceibacterota bacterium]|jgi:cell division protein FtsW|nr:putative peptidoglycan glycosyltransferase FtsW [Candidatus Paceibacterota bacterium]